MDMTNYAKDAIAKHIGNITSIGMPVLTQKLYTSNPTVSGGGTECADSNYAGQSVTWQLDGTNYRLQNTGALTYGGSGGFNSSATIVGAALVDGSGNMWFFKVFGSSIAIAAGERLTYDALAVTVTLSDATLTNYAKTSILNHIGNLSSISMPTLTQRLYTTAPTVSTSGTECADSNYSGQTCAFSFASHAISNTSALTFFGTTGANASASIVAEALKDGGGNLWFFKALVVTVAAAKRYVFDAAAITVTPA